jgi:hypothetical protein
VRPVPLTITVLPAWMRSSKFRALARAADRFVLQVHSLERPRGPGEPLVLCDTRAARRWARQANRVGVPFRVALPTYGYDVGFDSAGRFLGLAADGSPRGWPADAVVSTVRPDAAALAGLVAEWERRRPALLEGLIWYRLPVGHERLNWSWPTLAALVEGSVPRARVEARAAMSSSRLADVELENKGDGDAELAVRVVVRWSSARLVAADALAGFEIGETDAHRLTFVPASPPAGERTTARLTPGSSRRVGWLRFDREEVARVEIEPVER